MITRVKNYLFLIAILGFFGLTPASAKTVILGENGSPYITASAVAEHYTFGAENFKMFAYFTRKHKPLNLTKDGRVNEGQLAKFRKLRRGTIIEIPDDLVKTRTVTAKGKTITDLCNGKGNSTSFGDCVNEIVKYNHLPKRLFSKNVKLPYDIELPDLKKSATLTNPPTIPDGKESGSNDSVKPAAEAQANHQKNTPPPTLQTLQSQIEGLNNRIESQNTNIQSLNSQVRTLRIILVSSISIVLLIIAFKALSSRHNIRELFNNKLFQLPYSPITGYIDIATPKSPKPVKVDSVERPANTKRVKREDLSPITMGLLDVILRPDVSDQWPDYFDLEVYANSARMPEDVLVYPKEDGYPVLDKTRDLVGKMVEEYYHKFEVGSPKPKVEFFAIEKEKDGKLFRGTKFTLR